MKEKHWSPFARSITQLRQLLKSCNADSRLILYFFGAQSVRAFSVTLHLGISGLLSDWKKKRPHALAYSGSGLLCKYRSSIGVLY